MKIKTLLLIFTCWLIGLSACKNDDPTLPTVAKVDLQKYIGRWYEIARFPNSFEKELKCVTATYAIKNDGKISVTNKGVNINDPSKVSESQGMAWRPDKSKEGQLKVSFFWPFAGDYFIIALDEKNYQYALVGSPDRDYLWVLSRKPELKQETYQKLLKIAEDNKFDISKLKLTPQDCQNI
ncbi:lipocalin family protein [Limibacter armeniacum]|uniref:lipocalin family protein n=1 Tax=Limibacter armeniacum TaxID=466084 RepID=UPI002FE6159F